MGALHLRSTVPCPPYRKPSPSPVHPTHLPPPAPLPQFDALVPNAWRVANSNDAVTLVPRMMGYCHVGGWAGLGFRAWACTGGRLPALVRRPA